MSNKTSKWLTFLSAGDWIIKQGEDGEVLFVVDEG